MDDLVSELNKEVAKTRPKKRLKDNSAELAKQLEESLRDARRDARMCKKPKAAAPTDKPRSFNREYIYSGCSIKPKTSGIRTRVKALSSRPTITVESVTGLISVNVYVAICVAIRATYMYHLFISC